MSSKADWTRLEMPKNAVMALPDIRVDKVEALRQFVKTGKYDVTDIQIAGALLDDMRNGGSI